MTDYDGKERRDGEDRRDPPAPAPVAIDGWRNGAARDIRTAIRLGKGIFIFVVATAFSVGGYVVGQAATDERQDAALDRHEQQVRVNSDATVAVSRALAEALAEVNHTVATIVSEQRAMRRDFEREHGQR